MSDSESFLNQHVLPFVARLGSDELSIGTCKIAREEVLLQMWKAPGECSPRLLFFSHLLFRCLTFTGSSVCLRQASLVS